MPHSQILQCSKKQTGIINSLTKRPNKNTYNHKKIGNPPCPSTLLSLCHRTLLGEVGVTKTLGHNRVLKNVLL